MRVLIPVHMSKEDPNSGTLYCYRPIRVVNPNTGAVQEPAFSDLVWDPSPSANLPGLEPYIIQQAQVGNSGPAGQGRWGVCYTCRHEYPIGIMTIIRGRTYCSEHGCAEEAES